MLHWILRCKCIVFYLIVNKRKSGYNTGGIYYLWCVKIDKVTMKKMMLILSVLCVGAVSVHGQSKVKDTVYFDKSFIDAGTIPEDKEEYRLVPKFYKAGNLAPEQPIALATAKKEATGLVKAKPTQLRKDCLNIIYTVDPIYSEGSITGAVKGTIVIKWEPKTKIWDLSYLKYQLINIDQNACVFMFETAE